MLLEVCLGPYYNHYKESHIHIYFQVNCTTPRKDLLPPIPLNEHSFASNLTVKSLDASESGSRNFTFFDCDLFSSSCYDCVTSSFSCYWCFESQRCSHDGKENCQNKEVLGTKNLKMDFQRRFLNLLLRVALFEIESV